MDVEMEEFFKDPLLVEEFETDINYEFDAAMYYDFNRPETDFEAQVAESWFQTAPYYPPSPFTKKLNRKPIIPMESANSYCICKAGENMNPISTDLSTSMDSVVTAIDDNSKGQKPSNNMAQDIAKVKPKSRSPPLKISNFMNPTASQLAKQNYPSKIYCERLHRRLKKSVKKEEKSLLRSSIIESLGTKRQKLEAGYLRKVARLKHQTILLHKAPKKVGHADVTTALARAKVTIPKEPNLETAYRAERHRSKIIFESAENAKSYSCTFRARPLNRKILKAPSFPLRIKSTPQQPEFQVFHLRTLERAMQHASVNEPNIPNCGPISQNETLDPKRVNTSRSLKERLEAPEKFKGLCLSKKELNSSTDNWFPNEPPIDSFSKLSLAPKVHSTAKSESKMSMHFKGLKENAPGSLHLESEMMNVAKSPTFVGSRYQCWSDQKMLSIGPHIKINRSLDIR